MYFTVVTLGEWGEWGAYSGCTGVDCGIGTETRTKTCVDDTCVCPPGDPECMNGVPTSTQPCTGPPAASCGKIIQSRNEWLIL